MSSRAKISHAKLKDVYLEKIPFSSLDKYEKVMYSIYLWGAQDGREITFLETISKLDPALADELTSRFVGLGISELMHAATQEINPEDTQDEKRTAS